MISIRCGAKSKKEEKKNEWILPRCKSVTAGFWGTHKIELLNSDLRGVRGGEFFTGIAK